MTLRRCPLLLLMLFTLASPLAAQYWNPDSTFGAALESTAGNVGPNVTLAYPGGKVLVTVGGSIVNGTVVPSRFVRLNQDGSLDGTFAGPASVVPLIAYADGRSLVAAAIPDSNAFAIQRLLASGAKDASFASLTVNPSGTYSLGALVLADGRTLVYGDFTLAGGVARRGLLVLMNDGSVDGAFSSPFVGGDQSLAVNDVEQLASGQLMVAGRFYRSGQGQVQKLARLDLSGNVDLTFDASAAVSQFVPLEVFLQSDGKVVVVDGNGRLFRVTVSGNPDAAFVPTLVGDSFGFGPRKANGQIFYTANVTLGDGTYRQLRLMNADGTDDASFPVQSARAYTLYVPGRPVLNEDGTYLLQSALSLDRYNQGLRLARVLADGSIDPSFRPRFGQGAKLDAYARQLDGKHLVAGAVDLINNVPASAYTVARLLADGATDDSFSAAVNGSVSTIAVQPDGKILLGGYFPAGSALSYLIRLHADGSNDASFPPLTRSYGQLAIDGAGYIYVLFNDDPHQIVRYTPDGVADSSFASLVFGDFVTSMVALTDGTVLAEVTPLTLGGLPQLKRLLHSGAVDPNFASPAHYGTVALGALPGGSALMVEQTSGSYGAPSLTVSRVRPTGQVDFKYTTPDSAATFIDERTLLLVGGGIFDLLREGSTSSTAQVDVRIGYERFSARGDGQLMVMSTNPQALVFQRYQRSALTTPSFDAAPAISGFFPGAPVAPLNAPYSVGFVRTSGLFPFTYVWRKNGVPIPDSNEVSFWLTRIQASDAGEYSVVISNAYGSVTSPVTTLSVDTTRSAAIVLSPPVDQVVSLGYSAVFTVVADGTPPLSYRWQMSSDGGLTWSNLYDGGIYLGTDGPMLTIAGVAGGIELRQFRVAVSNDGATVVTAGARVTLRTAVVGGGVPRSADFNGDGKPDLLWSNSVTGERAIWLMNGTNFLGASTLGNFPVQWTIASTADYNADGKTDIIWSNSITGERAIWLMNGTNLLGTSTLGVFPLEWTVAATADFNADGKPDIIWSNSITGERAIWLMNGTNFLAASTLGVFPLEWTVAATGDFNADGKPDIIWSNSITGERAIWLMNGTNFLAASTLGVFPREWTVAGTADFNADGKPDIIWSNSITGERALWLMNGTNFLAASTLGIFPLEWTVSN